ncbi:MAG TPA: FAD-binding protein [Rhizomicrobium sp.]|jgi:glycolate oxidase FAD binding subunit|nr:FAD-binding protein [Rhizomicrobium sp.]
MTRVSSESQIVDFVRAARAGRSPFEIVAGGTRRGVGRPMASHEGKALPVLDVSGVAGIIDYQPEELIVTARPGTSLAELKALLAAKNQCLGFDPVSWTFLTPPPFASTSAATGTSPASAPMRAQGRRASDASTLGGAVSADASGPGRLRHGPPRDSLLGFRAVNGFGEAFRGGAKVVKNVTGFDLPKLVCGAFGTLMVLSEMTFRVYPRPNARATLILRDRAPDTGFAALRTIWKSALEPSGLSYIPGSAKFPGLGDVGEGAALIRFEAAEMPLSEKLAAARLLVGGAEEISEGDRIFTAIGEGALFQNSDLEVWRVSVPPAEAARVAGAIGSPHWLGDWAGGLLWIGARGEDAPRIRALAMETGGHAMLLRAPASRRAELGLFAPQAPPLAALTASVRAAFDPLSLFNPGRL